MAKALTESGPLQIAVDYAFDPLRLHASAPQRYPFLLESTAQGTPQGRYDVLMAFPAEVLKSDGRAGRGPAFLDRLDRAWRESAPATGAGAAPFVGGWFLLLGYEFAAEIETSLALPVDADMPAALAVRVRAALVRDHARREAWLAAEPGAERLLEDMQRDLRTATPDWVDDPRATLADTLEEEPPARFLEAVRRAKGHIAAGDIFQANLSRQWCGSLAAEVSPHALYARLRNSNPGPFAGLAVFDEFALVSSSPERLVPGSRWPRFDPADCRHATATQSGA